MNLINKKNLVTISIVVCFNSMSCNDNASKSSDSKNNNLSTPKETVTSSDSKNNNLSTPKETVTSLMVAADKKDKDGFVNCFSKISFKYDNVLYRSLFQQIFKGDLNKIGDPELEELRKLLNKAEITNEVVEGDDAEISLKLILPGDTSKSSDGQIYVGKPNESIVKAKLQKKNVDWLIIHL